MSEKSSEWKVFGVKSLRKKTMFSEKIWAWPLPLLGPGLYTLAGIMTLIMTCDLQWTPNTAKVCWILCYLCVYNNVQILKKKFRKKKIIFSFIIITVHIHRSATFCSSGQRLSPITVARLLCNSVAVSLPAPSHLLSPTLCCCSMLRSD